MGNQYRDYYQILGVPPHASAEEIRQAFRLLAREHHPDVARNQGRAEEKFKEIAEAYKVLRDPNRRKGYDTLRAGRSGAGAGLGPGFADAPAADPASDPPLAGPGFGRFFKQLFRFKGAGQEPGSAVGPGDAARGPGDASDGEILVSAEEARQGTVRVVAVQQTRPCTLCCATGCVGRKVCEVCKGAGCVVRTQNYQVKIPAGVVDGQPLRLNESPGGRPGNGSEVYFRVRFKPAMAPAAGGRQRAEHFEEPSRDQTAELARLEAALHAETAGRQAAERAVAELRTNQARLEDALKASGLQLEEARAVAGRLEHQLQELSEQRTHLAQESEASRQLAVELTQAKARLEAELGLSALREQAAKDRAGELTQARQLHEAALVEAQVDAARLQARCADLEQQLEGLRRQETVQREAWERRLEAVQTEALQQLRPAAEFAAEIARLQAALGAERTARQCAEQVSADLSKVEAGLYAVAHKLRDLVQGMGQNRPG